MPQIVQQGAINTTALIVPDLYVQIVPPANLAINGVPTDVVGVVGTASWGPVNLAAIVATASDYATAFGPVMARKYDMGTQVATSIQQGAANFRCVRVTDGTDMAATSDALAANIMLTAKYTGSLGDTLVAYLSPGSGVNTWRVVVTMPGLQPELFDNIPAPPTGATSAQLMAFWQSVVTAINTGIGLRGPSNLIMATIGTGTMPTAPMTATYTFAGGADGATTITAATLIGVDIIPRMGMYALRGQGCSIGVLSDADDYTQYTTQAQYGYSEGTYMILTGPAGDTIANAVLMKQEAGLDDYSCKLMFGDWIYWNDQVNGILRLVSPQGFAAGRLANLSPEQSSLNKELYSVVASQMSGAPGSTQFGMYSSADLGVLFQAGIDVIANPQPGGAYWGVRCGHNSSTNAAINGDNYTRLTNYIAATMAASMGLFVGGLINPTSLKQIRATQLSFFQNMLTVGQLGANLDGSLPYTVVCDESNNPFSLTSLGYCTSTATVTYQAINEKFILNMQGGQTVVQPSTALTQPNSTPATPTF